MPKEKAEKSLCMSGLRHAESVSYTHLFMGSGTTGMVAAQMGRHFVGIELNPEYTELAYKRIGGEI